MTEQIEDMVKISPKDQIYFKMRREKLELQTGEELLVVSRDR